jgi:hypothetical protein
MITVIIMGITTIAVAAGTGGFMSRGRRRGLGIGSSWGRRAAVDDRRARLM